MNPKRLVLSLALLVAACGGANADDQATTTAAPDTETTEPESAETTTPAGEEGPSLTVAQGWTAQVLGSGIKPALALHPSGEPGVTWLREAIGDGFVAFASAADGWEVETIAEGYFYGPIDLAFDPTGAPNVVIHDHQDDAFQPDLGELVRWFKDGSGWVEDIAQDPGHDGWDSTVVIGDDGSIHAAGVDPAQFGSPDGVEYYHRGADGWTVTQVGSGPIPYQYNVSLALDPDGNPSLTYYNDADQDLVFAQLAEGSWVLEQAATEGDVGKYSSLAYDPEGRPAVSFFRQTGSSTGEIVFARRSEGAWVEEPVGTLAAFEENNARRNSALAFDSQGRAHVVFSDTEGVWHAVRGEEGWETAQIVEAGLLLGQLVSFALDPGDHPHIAIYEITESGPLDGLVVYLTAGK